MSSDGVEGAVAVLTSAVDALAALAVSCLPLPEVQRLTSGLGRQSERLSGVLSRAVGEVAERSGGPVPHGPVGVQSPIHVWLRDVRRVSGSEAGRQVRTALGLRELPLVAQAVIDGALPAQSARHLTRLVGRIDPAALAESQPVMLAVVVDLPPDAVARQVQHWLATFCEPALDEADECAVRARRLVLADRHDGSHRGGFLLPDGEMELVRSVLEPLSRRAGDEDLRSAAQRRADALVEVFELARRFAELPEAGGQRANVDYVVPADWLGRHTPPAFSPAALLATSGPAVPGAADRPGVDRPGVDGRGADRPGAVVPAVGCATGAWTGPQTRARIEAVLCDCRASRVVLGPLGQVRALQAIGDTVTRAQRRALAARDRHCTARGCTRPPAFTDAHHLKGLADGGPTTVDNLVLLCRRHHVLWHQGGLTLADLRIPWHPSRGPAPAPT